MGAGVGASLGAAFLAALAAFLWQYMKNRSLKRELAAAKGGTGYSPRELPTSGGGRWPGGPMAVPVDQKWRGTGGGVGGDGRGQRTMGELDSVGSERVVQIDTARELGRGEEGGGGTW